MPTSVAALRARIAAIEGLAPVETGWTVPERAVGIGVAEVDALLPWRGVPFGLLHEVAPLAPQGPAARWGAGLFNEGPALGFAARLLGRLAAARGRPALWVAEGGMPYAPTLAALGLPPERLVVVAAGRPSDLLWALETAARSPGAAAVLGEVRGMEFAAARRLALAARQGGTALLLLNRSAEAIRPAATRWRIGAAPAPAAVGLGPRRWRVELAACRGRGLAEGDRVAGWEVEWEEGDGAGDLRLVAGLRDRPAGEPTARVA